MSIPEANIPNPDPSTLTVEMLRREIGAQRELFDAKILALEKSVYAFQENVVRVPTDTTTQIHHLKELHDEKFTAVDAIIGEVRNSFRLQLQERDIRSAASEDAAKVAVSVGLSAAKENVASQNAYNAASIAKSEAASTKQVDAIVALLASNNAAIADKISGITARLDRGDGQNTSSQTSTATLIAIIASIAAVLGVGISFYTASGHNSAALQATLPYTLAPQAPPVPIAPR